MKTLAHYMSLPYPMEIIPDEGGYVASVPDLPGCMARAPLLTKLLRDWRMPRSCGLREGWKMASQISEPTDIDDYSGKFVCGFQSHCTDRWTLELEGKEPV